MSPFFCPPMAAEDMQTRGLGTLSQRPGGAPRHAWANSVGVQPLALTLCVAWEINTAKGYITIRYDTVRCGAIRYDTIQSNNILRYATILCKTLTRYRRVRYSSIWCNTTWYKTLRYDMIRYDTIELDMMRYSKIHCCLGRFHRRINHSSGTNTIIKTNKQTENSFQNAHCTWKHLADILMRTDTLQHELRPARGTFPSGTLNAYFSLQSFSLTVDPRKKDTLGC